MASIVPLICLLTGGTSGGAHPRIASWLRVGFERLDAPFDSVHVEAPAGFQVHGSTRVVRLGTHRLHRAGVPIRRYLRHTRPALTIATPIEVAVVALLASKGSRSSIVPWEQTMVRFHRRDGRFRVLPQLELMTYGGASAVAATSSDVRDDLIAHLGRRARSKSVEIIPNPIDADEIRRLAGSPIRRNGPLRFCAVGRLAPEKGYDVLLAAAAAAAPKLGRSWELVIVGDGPLARTLERQVEALDLKHHVRLAGFVQNPYQLMAESDIFVHAARTEGFGLVLGEALSLGLPVIATACRGGPRDILDDGAFGVLVQPNCPLALAEAMVAVAGDRQLRADLSTGGPERVRAFAPETVAEKFISLAHKLQD